MCQLCSRSSWLWEYLEAILDLVELEHSRGNTTPLKLVIMGRDPYPKAAMGIPFAKPTVQQTARSLSGGKIIQSLAIDTKAWQGKDVQSLFEKLLRQRIAFLNASYKYLGKGPITLGKHGAQLHCANAINSVIINSTENVVLCGEAAKGYKWANGLSSGAILPAKFHCATHPSARVYNRDEAEFQKYWAPNALMDMFNLGQNMAAVNNH